MKENQFFGERWISSASESEDYRQCDWQGDILNSKIAAYYLLRSALFWILVHLLNTKHYHLLTEGGMGHILQYLQGWKDSKIWRPLSKSITYIYPNKWINFNILMSLGVAA